MLIRLLPTPPHPSVLFNITFEDLPDGLSLPPTWTTHLSNLMHDELPIPRWQHTLDKATFFPCVLDEVIFDIPAVLVTCRFVDGTIADWKINADGLATKCLKTLESVVDDVYLSTLIVEQERQREKRREEEQAWERERERLRQQQLVSLPSLVKNTKHKKKRSILMTLVSGLSSLNSIINLSLPSPTILTISSSIPLMFKPYATPSMPTYNSTPFPQNICPRFLRRRARSSLVDAFRLYVLYELNQRIPQGGYYIWILHSLLNEVRHCQEERLAREREKERKRLKSWSPPPQCISLLPPGSDSASNLGTSSTVSSSLLLFDRKRQNIKHERRPSHETFSATTSCKPPVLDDEEEVDSVSSCRTQEKSDEADAEITDTDTDESSIQTPTSEHFDLPLGLPSAIASQDLSSLPSASLIPISNQSYLNFAPPTSNSTHFHIHNLTQLILLHNSHSAQMAYEENTRLDALEVRGKRRAWLNCALCPNGIELTRSLRGAKISHQYKVKIGIGAPYSRLGFSYPIHRSALGIWVVNAEDIESEQVAPMEHKGASSGQIDSIILEDDMQFVGEERFAGYDERNGIEPKRSRISVPSKDVQLLPVCEVEEEEGMKHNQSTPYVPSKPSKSTEHGDDEFCDLNLNQLDDLRELQMDLDIFTGAGFDIMDSSDDQDTECHVNIPRRQSGTATRIPEGMASDSSRHRVLHTRSSQFLSCQKQCQRQRVLEASCGQEHHGQQYLHPATLSERCHTPISFLEPASEPVKTETSISVYPSSVSSISVPRPATLPAISSKYAANDPINQSGPLCVAKTALETPFRSLSRASSRDLKPASIDGSELGPIPHNASVNDMGELVAGMDTVGLGEEGREEFTLAMDLPLKLSKLSEMDFAAMGQTRGIQRAYQR